MYALAERISDKVTTSDTKPENGHLGVSRRKKSEKIPLNSIKTGCFAGIRTDCYIMATMGRKLSVYVNICLLYTSPSPRD